MRILVILFLFFFIPIPTFAESAYLKEFEVLNGELSIPFNDQNNIYTIYLEEDAQKVEFTYTLEDSESVIDILDNSWIAGKENIMILKVKSKNEIENQTYTFYLEKEDTQTVTLDNSTYTSLDITKKERSPYLAPSIIIGCALLIGIMFYLLIIRYIKKIRRKNHQ